MSINHIRIFISSTFDDMRIERKVLVEKVFPQIRKLANDRGVFFSYVDLRWGVLSGTKAAVIISKCLSEIEDCSPFFIGIVGNECGRWNPEEKLSKEECEQLGNRFQGVDELLKNKKRLTEIEMRYRLLYDKDVQHTFFYLRDNEFCRDTIVVKFRQFLDGKYNERIQHFSPIYSFKKSDTFAKIVYDDFAKLIEDIPEKPKLAVNSVRCNQELFLQLIRTCYYDDAAISALDCFLTDDSRSFFILYGERGLGKTYTLADFIGKHEHCYYHFIGHSQREDTLQIVLGDIYDQLCLISEKHQCTYCQESLSFYNRELDSLYKETSDLRKVIIIDDLDSLVCSNEDRLSFLYNLPCHPSVRYIVSSNEAFAPRLYASRMNDVSAFQMKPLEGQNAISFAKNYLRSFYGKQPEVVDNSMSHEIYRNESLHRPFLLTLFLEEIVVSGNYDNLDNVSLALSNEDSILVSLISRLKKQVPARII